MSVADKVLALLAPDADPRALNGVVAIANDANRADLLALQDLLKTTIQEASKNANPTLSWQKLLSALLYSQNTRQEAFLFAIQSVQNGVLPTRLRHLCLGELHTAGLHYTGATDRESREVKKLVQAILTPADRCFSRSASLEPSDDCLCLFGVLSTMINGRKSSSSNAPHVIAQLSTQTPLLADFELASSPKFQALILNTVVSTSPHVSLIPAVLNLLMESPISSTQLLTLASSIRKSFSELLSRASSTHVSLIPSWILTITCKACISFLQFRDNRTAIGHTRKCTDSRSFPFVSTWISLLRFVLDLSFLSWTREGSTLVKELDLARFTWETSAERVSDDFDASVVVCTLDLGVRQSVELPIILTNYYVRRMIYKAPTQGQNRELNSSDFLLLVFLLQSSLHAPHVLRLLFEIISRLVIERSEAECAQLAHEIASLPGTEPQSQLFLKLALHCVECITLDRFAKLGSATVVKIHEFAKQVLCTLFETRDNLRKSILLLCFAPSAVVVIERQRMMYQWADIKKMRDEFACGTLEAIAAKRRGTVLLPLSRVILDALPYLTTTHANNLSLCNRLITATLPLCGLDQAFQTQTLIFLRKLLHNRSVLETSIAYHALSTIIARQLVPEDVQCQLLDTLINTPQPSLKHRLYLYKSILYIMETVTTELNGSQEKNESGNSSLKELTYSSEPRIIIACKLIDYVRRQISKHWTHNTTSSDSPSYELSIGSFFQSLSSPFSKISSLERKDSMRLIFTLLVSGAQMFGAVLKCESFGNSTISPQYQAQLMEHGKTILNVFISASNEMGKLGYVAFKVLRTESAAVSLLKRRIATLDDQYSVLNLPLHEASRSTDTMGQTTEFGDLEDDFLQFDSSDGISLVESLNPALLVKLLQNPFATASEALLDEARRIASDLPSLFVLSENSALSLAATKGLYLLELRGSMEVCVDMVAAKSKRDNHAKKAKEVETIQEPVSSVVDDDSGFAPPNMSIRSMLAILRRFTMKERLLDTEIDESDETTFLPKPSLIALRTTLSLLNDYLNQMRSELDAHDSQKLTTWPTVAQFSELLSLAFIVLQLLSTSKNLEDLPSGIRLNSMMEILMSKQEECARFVLNEAKVLLLSVFASTFAVLEILKVSIEDVIGNRSDDFQSIYEEMDMVIEKFRPPSNSKKRKADASETNGEKSDLKDNLRVEIQFEVYSGPGETFEPSKKKRSLAPLDIPVSDSSSGDSSLPVPLASKEEENASLQETCVTSGLICFYFAKLASQEFNASSNVQILLQYVQIMHRIRATWRSSVAKANLSEEARFDASALFLLGALGKSLPLGSKALETILEFILNAFTRKTDAIIVASALIERASSELPLSGPLVSVPGQDIPVNVPTTFRRRSFDPREHLLASLAAQIPLKEKSCLFAAVDVCVASLNTLFSFTSNPEEWYLQRREMALMCMALRKMSSAPSSTPMFRTWTHFFSLCTALVRSAHVNVERFLRKASVEDAVEALQLAVVGEVPVSEKKSLAFVKAVVENEANWDAKEGWLVSILALGPSVRVACGRLKRSLFSTKKSVFKQPPTISKLQTLQSRCKDVLYAPWLAPEVAALLALLLKYASSGVVEFDVESGDGAKRGRKARKAAKEGEEDVDSEAERYATTDSSSSSSWDSVISSSEDEEDEGFLINTKKRRARKDLNMLRSANPFIDEALRVEEGHFQDEDDYADLESWIVATGDDDEDDDHMI